MKKLSTVVTFLFITIASLYAQDIQFHYDFGSALYHSGYKSERYTRPNLATAVEMFKPDKWGHTFFLWI